MIGRDHSLGKP